MLEKLGVYGFEAVEDAILAGLVTGDPVLLVGSHGTAKTLLCRRLAEALGLRFFAYDASKALFEDVLGFPNPQSLAEGKVDYVSTPLSIWDKEFVLVDELSRANPAMQNKWLELIRSRQVMGLRLDNIRHIFAAMNPPDYLGAHPLDPALAGRFAVVVPVPEVLDMPEPVVSKIVVQISEDDAPMLKRRKNAHLQDPEDPELGPFLDLCRRRMDDFPEEDKQNLVLYVSALSRSLAAKNAVLDGRRLGMIWRTLLAGLCVRMEKKGIKSANPADLEDELMPLLPFTLPFTALGEGNLGPLLRLAHLQSRAALFGREPRKVFVMKNPGPEAARDFIEKSKGMKGLEKKQSLTAFLTRLKTAEDAEETASSLLALHELARAACEGELELAPETCRRLLAAYNHHTGRENLDGLFGNFIDFASEEELESITEPGFFIALRFAFSADPGDSPSHPMRGRWRKRKLSPRYNSAECKKVLEELMAFFRLRGLNPEGEEEE